MRLTLFLLLIGLVVGPVLCGPSPALAALAAEASVTRALDAHALDACDDQAQPPVTVGSSVIPLLGSLASVARWVVPGTALPLLGDAFTLHGTVRLRTPLRL